MILVADHIIEPLINGERGDVNHVKKIAELVGSTSIDIEPEPSHDVCELTGEETTVYAVGPKGWLD